MKNPRVFRISIFFLFFMAAANIAHTQSMLLVAMHPSEISEISPLDFGWARTSLRQAGKYLFREIPFFIHFAPQVEASLERARLQRAAILIAA